MDPEFLAKFDRLVEDAAATRKLCTEARQDMEVLKLEFNKLKSTVADNDERLTVLEADQRRDRAR